MSPRDMSPQNHGIVLSGGGANGAYGLGVMEALLGGRCEHSKQVNPSVFTGTSVGCFNAAVMASLPDRSGLEAARFLRRLWLDEIAEHEGRPNGVFRLRGNPRTYRDTSRLSGSRREDLFDFPRDIGDLAASLFQRGLDLTFSKDAPVRRILRFFDVADLVSTDPLKRLIAKTVETRRLLESDKKLRIVASNWDTGEPVVFYNQLEPGEKDAEHRDYQLVRLTEDNTEQAILASTAIPAFFPRVTIGDEYFVDGGVVMNTPLNPAVEAGATVIHVIHLEPELEVLPYGRAPSAFEAVERILAATPVRLIDSDIRYAELRNDLINIARELGRTGGSRNPIVEKYSGSSKIVIHRYFPSRQIGGAIGLLDFSRKRLTELIELGFRDAVKHDCKHCVL